MTVTNVPKNIHEVSFEQRAKELHEEKQTEEEQEKAKRKSPFQRFYQVNKDKSECLLKCAKENSKALEILLFIFNHMDKYNAVVCSYKVFQEALVMSKATVQRAIKYLKDNGFVYIYKTGSSNVYVANKDLVWNSWGNNRQYCEFPANIVLSSTEQEDKVEVRDKRITSVQIKQSNQHDELDEEAKQDSNNQI